jgi:hypothetical protein
LKEFFTKLDCQILRESINRALLDVAKQNGVTLKVGNMKYSSTNINIAVEAILLSDNGENLNDKRTFEELAELYGLKVSDYGKKFSTVNGEYTLVRIDSKKRNYPIIAKNKAGTTYKFSSEAVIKALQKELTNKKK